MDSNPKTCRACALARAVTVLGTSTRQTNLGSCQCKKMCYTMSGERTLCVPIITPHLVMKSTFFPCNPPAPWLRHCSFFHLQSPKQPEERRMSVPSPLESQQCVLWSIHAMLDACWKIEHMFDKKTRFLDSFPSRFDNLFLTMPPGMVNVTNWQNGAFLRFEQSIVVW